MDITIFLLNYLQFLDINIKSIMSKKNKNKNDREILNILTKEQKDLILFLKNYEGDDICLK